MEKNSFNKYAFNENQKGRKFADFLADLFLSERTIKIYCSVVRMFLSKYSLTQENLIKWFRKKEHRRKYQRQALIWYLKYLGRNDLRVPDFREPKRRPREIPKREEIKEKIEELRPNPEVYLIFKLLYYTGLRIHEVLELKLNHFDEERKIIIVPTKGGKLRKVLLDENLFYEIVNYAKKKGVLGEEKIFFTNAKDVDSAYRMLRYYLDKFRLKDLKRTHDLRRALINFLIEKTGDILVAKSFIGHEDIKTTMRYVSELTEEKKAKEGFEVLKSEG